MRTRLRAALVVVLAATGVVLTTTSATAAPTRYEAETAPASCDGADLVDSVHPNDAGHAKIAQRLTPVIDQYV